MSLTLVTDATAEPVSLSEIKSSLRIDGTQDDTLLSNYITAARIFCEKFSQRAFVTQTWDYKLDEFPDEILVPLPPLQSVSSITYVDSDSTTQTWDSSNYQVDTDSEPGRIVPATGQAWATGLKDQLNPITVRFVAGYGGAADVPWTTKQAICLLVGDFYEHRENTLVGGSPKQLPFAVESLLLITDWGARP